jgi:hypothetical protein
MLGEKNQWFSIFFCTIVGKRQREKGTIGNEGEEIEYFAMLEANDRGIEAVNIFN